LRPAAHRLPNLPVRAGPAPAYYPVATVYDWGGGYIGINGGYGFGQSQWSDALNPSGNTSTGNFNVSGGLVGLTMGVGGQFGAFVLGVEGDFDWQISVAPAPVLFAPASLLRPPYQRPLPA